MRPTALGYVLLLMRAPHPLTGWLVVWFSAAGRERGYTPCATRSDAVQHRTKMRRHHARLAAERAARSAARKRKGA